ncbi:MAG: SUMF1/EgtB/PvdO family nonheme iron enzyme [Myxococcales bacterium]|nr:SUMF1/EgtB/PvdO family nonheme iron enzyme [Myxococcales bacterium]
MQSYETRLQGDRALETLTAHGLVMRDVAGGIVEIGAKDKRFSFDNELRRHQVLLREYRLANRCVTNGEVADFVSDGGYERPELWLSDGWATVQSLGWRGPLYWQRESDDWYEYNSVYCREDAGAKGCENFPQQNRRSQRW